MEIIISNSSGKPIYEQIAEQIKAMILNGELETGAALAWKKDQAFSRAASRFLEQIKNRN